MPDELERAHEHYMELAKDIANDRMADEIFPIVKRAFSSSPIIARNWHPLRINFRGVSDLGMKLKIDPFVWMILRDRKLMERIEKIVLESLEYAFARDAEIQGNPFIAAILRGLITGDSRLDPATENNR